MQRSAEIPGTVSQTALPRRLPVTVVIPTRNEARHLSRCLEAARLCSEIYVIDSQSTDETVEIARTFDAKVVQFHYGGGWPKKRQWALDSLSFENEWVLLLDADEILRNRLSLVGSAYWLPALVLNGEQGFSDGRDRPVCLNNASAPTNS